MYTTHALSAADTQRCSPQCHSPLYHSSKTEFLNWSCKMRAKVTSQTWQHWDGGINKRIVLNCLTLVGAKIYAVGIHIFFGRHYEETNIDFFILQARATSDRSHQLRRPRQSYTMLCTQGSPINATTTSWFVKLTSATFLCRARLLIR